jgi:hypothetical protein
MCAQLINVQAGLLRLTSGVFWTYSNKHGPPITAAVNKAVEYTIVDVGLEDEEEDDQLLSFPLFYREVESYNALEALKSEISWPPFSKVTLLSI